MVFLLTYESAYVANSSHLCDVGDHGPHHPPRVPPAQGFRSLPSNVFGSKVEGGFYFYFPGMLVFSQFDIKLIIKKHMRT